MDRVIYEHINYFKDFDKNRSFPFKNWPERNKVLGGLWGCRVGASYGWRYVAKEARKELKTLSEEERNEIYELTGKIPEQIRKPVESCSKFYFVLKPWANNYIIHTFDDYQKLPKMIADDKEVVNYEQCLKDGIDAIELCAIGDEYDNLSTQEDFDKLDEIFGVYWNCDSILVLNKDAYEIAE